MPEDRGLYQKKEQLFTYNLNGKNYLFAIGINNYVHFPKLHNAVKDAQDLINVLTTYYLFEEKNVITLFDSMATMKNIIRKFKYLAGRLKEDDNLLIYFSGHGYQDPIFKIGYWIPVEAADEVADYLPNSSVKDYLKAINTHHTFLMADACFSGSLFSTIQKRLDTERYAEQVDKHKSRWALTSGRLEVVSDGQIGTNSPFASYLLKYLRQEGTSPFAVSDLVQYVKKATANNAKQTPIGGPLQAVGDEGGEFVFYPKASEELAWHHALATHTIAAYEAFLAKYPQSKHAFEAESKIIQLKEAADEQAFLKATTAHTVLAYLTYLEKYPNGKFANQAKTKIREIERLQREQVANQALNKAKRNQSISELMDFIDEYADFPALIEQAKALIEKIKNKQTPKSNPTPLIDKEKAKAKYAELFEVFYEDKTITSKERKQLKEKQAELGLTDLEVKAIEDSIINKVPPISEKARNFVKDNTKPILRASVALAILLIIVINWESIKHGFTKVTSPKGETTVTSPSGEIVVSDATNSVSPKGKTTVTSPSGEIVVSDVTNSVSPKGETTVTSPSGKTTVTSPSGEEKAKQEEKTAYEALKNTQSSLTAFLQKYPNSQYAESVQQKLNTLKRAQEEKTAYNKTVEESTFPACESFLAKYPNSEYASEIRNLKIRLERNFQKAMQDASASYALEDYENAKKYYKQALKIKPNHAEAKRQLQAIEALY